ncbi:MAG TPA: aminotransferase class I/II-fold pyridoxal phosphate-dependent enzyme, partial [Chloroflexota bacterium]|nr:aminotransferase class I/II-fold pyridoxal phosphate-dependent enzyme [Chloroflexota bacterium]
FGDPWRLDLDELAAAFNERTAGIVINTPNNPTGKVLTRAELEAVAALCRRWDVLAVTDEIYEHIVYRGEHVLLATLPGMAERTVTISGIGKTYSVTGWRVGWAIAPPRVSGAIRKVHDFLTVGAAAPLQAAAAVALDLPESYYVDLVGDYTRKRSLLLEGLARAGFRFAPPDGAYYVMADISPFGLGDDAAFARHLVEALGVAVVPGTSFYPHGPDGGQGRERVRFSFPKRLETLRRAAERLAQLNPAQPGG